MSTISIVVSVHNRASYLFHSIGNWLQGLTLPDKILVIDDRSQEDIYGVCQQYSEWKRLVHYYRVKDEGQGWRNPGICHNFGVRHCGTDYYVIVDPETLFIGDCIGVTKSWLDVRPKSFVNAGIYYKTNKRYHSQFDPFDVGAVVNHSQIYSGFPLETGEWQVCHVDNAHAHTYAAGHVRNYVAIGGKDERMTGYGWEDSDLRDRMLRNGYTHDTTNDIAVIHVGHSAMRSASLEIKGTGPTAISITFPKGKGDWMAKIRHNSEIWAANMASGVRITNQDREWGVLPIEEEHRW